MTTWTSTLAIGGRVRHHGEFHTVAAIEGSLVTFRSQQGRAWVADSAGSWRTARRSWQPTRLAMPPSTGSGTCSPT
jgi:hypothetical protein